MLDERKLQVLYAIIDSYISSGEPIGSRTISKKYDFGVSAATIRNEMSDLEELGYLGKPHTSSGRIPSDKAYRYYVDHFLAQNLLHSMQFHRILKQEAEAVSQDDVKSLLEMATNMLVQWTEYTAVGSYSEQADEKLDRVTLHLVEAGLLLVILAYTHQKSTNHLLHIDEMIEDDIFSDLEEKINTIIAAGESKEKIKDELTFLLGENSNWRKALYRLIASQLELSNALIVLSGLSNIYKFPEFQDAGKARDFLLFFEDAVAVSQLFAEPLGELEIRIGEENEEERLKFSSVLTASYHMQTGQTGKIALIGPTRMDYTKALRAVHLITENLQSLFSLET